MPDPKLRPCKRHIASHDSSGKSVYATSPPLDYWETRPDISLARSYAIANIPANLEKDADLKSYLSDDRSGVTSHKRREIVVPPEGGKNNGANVLVVDLAPGAASAMHQTVSIDFSICVMGEIEHELDSGEKVRLLPGDHIIQRGTNHKWINASNTEPARFIGITLPCVPFDIAGKTLQEVHLPNKRAAKL